MKFSFVTYDQLPDLDPDDQLVVAEIRRRGHHCDAVIWNDDSVDWSSSGVCVIRNTWDYHLQPEKFLAWAELPPRLLNTVELVRWNIDKKYLLDLHSRNIRIVPTLVFHKGSTYAQCLGETGWERIVVKPTVGLATSGVKMFDTTSSGIVEAEKHLSELLQSGDVLLQPYLHSVETYGERSLIFIDGLFSHAVRKTPFQIMAVAGQAGETLVQATNDEIEFGKTVIRAIDQTPLYARVDVVPDETGNPCLLELELIEPSLFFSLYAPAVVSFADALERAIS